MGANWSHSCLYDIRKNHSNLEEGDFGSMIRFGLLICVLCHLACADQTGVVQNTSRDSDTWMESILETRREKDEEFKTSPMSPMAGVKRLTVDGGKKTFVVLEKREASLSFKNIQSGLLSLTAQDGKWSWEALGPPVTCESGEKPLNSGSQLADHAVFKAGDFTLAAYPSPERLILLVFDSKRPALRNFSHLHYFDPDASFAVEARMEKYPEMTKVVMLTSRNLEKTFYRYAKLSFQIKNASLALTAFKSSLEGPHSHILFIPFKDGTSGGETYGGGRFLEIPEPETGIFTLDFNHCFNPLCNYSPAYNCPLPPMENILDVPIRAGEKTYPHGTDH